MLKQYPELKTNIYLPISTKQPHHQGTITLFQVLLHIPLNRYFQHYQEVNAVGGQMKIVLAIFVFS